MCKCLFLIISSVFTFTIMIFFLSLSFEHTASVQADETTYIESYIEPSELDESLYDIHIEQFELNEYITIGHIMVQDYQQEGKLYCYCKLYTIRLLVIREDELGRVIMDFE